MLLLAAVGAAPTAQAQGGWFISGDWHDEVAADDLTAARLNAATVEIYTGLASQYEPTTACTGISISVHSDSQSIFGIHHYRQNERRSASLVNQQTIIQPTSDDQIRIYLRSGYASGAATLIASVAVDTITCFGVVPPVLNLAWSVTVFDSWTDQGSHSDEAAGAFSPAVIRASASRTDTGLAFHQSNSCKKVNVALAAGAPDSVELVRYAGASPAASTSLMSIHMEEDHADDNHVRLMFKAGAALTAGSEMTVTVSGTRHSSCAGAAPPTDPSIEWKLTVGTPVAWVYGEHYDEIAASGLVASDLNAAATDTWAGLAFHRTAGGCDRRAALASGSRAAFGLHRYDGNARETAALASELRFSGSEHVRVYLRRSHQHVGGTVTVRMVASGECADAGSNPAPQTLAWAVTIAEPTAWRALSADAQPAGFPSFRWSDMAGGLATGVRLHRSSDNCRLTDVELLSGMEHLELVRYTAAGAADGAGAAAFMAVRMEEGAAADRHVRLRFQAGALPPALVTATVRIAAAADCGSRRKPAPASFTYVLAVDADFDPAPELRVAPQTVSITRNAVATGVRAVAVDNDDADVAVAIDAAAARIFELRGSAGEYELRVRAAAELEVGVYTVTFTATDDAGGAAVTAQAAAVVRVRLGSAAATEAAAADAGGAAVRALGVSGIDAVLDRGPAADAGAGLALLEMLAAKEPELESGEIGLREFLEGQAVALPLSQTGAGGYDVGLWLAGGRRDVGGVETDAAGAAVYVDGEASSTVFGVDARRGQVLAGLGYGLHGADVEYGYEASRAADAPSGYELELRALQPYVAVDFGGARLALAAAAGGGDLILRRAGAAAETLDVDYVGYAAGVAQRVALADGELRLRGSYAAGELDVAEAAGAASLDAEGGVLRLGLGYGREFAVGPASSASPFLELGYLILDGDGADDASGLLRGGTEFAGGQLAGGFSYQHAMGDATLAGYDFSIRFSPRLGGLGLGFEADPGYGLAGTEDLLADLGAGQAMALDADGYGLRGGAGLSYGLAVAGGLLTPYGRWSAGAGRELGLRLRAGARRSWALGYGAAADEFKIEYRLGE